MKLITILYTQLKALIKVLFIVLFFLSCDQDILDEIPLDSLSSDNVLTSPEGFQNYLVALSRAAREEMTMDDKSYVMNCIGTDIASAAGVEHVFFKDYTTYLTPALNFTETVWDWAYMEMIMPANTVIGYAEKEELSGIWNSEQERNAVIAEARFYRAYTYNLLANTYGGVPLVTEFYSEPNVNFERASRQETYELAKKDLEFASEWLPETVEDEGRIVKAAANHLLSEVYISLGEYDNAIESASKVIDSGKYQLMTSRFGINRNGPGDVYSDLFQDGNQNRSSGNLETIYVWQIEEYTVGGSGTYSGNSHIRQWGPFLVKIKAPDGIPILASDSLNRGVGACRGSNYLLYDIWKDNWDNDIRNSAYNMRRNFYYNNPKSAYYGQEVEKRTVAEDTLRNMYAYPRKIEGKAWLGDISSGRTSKDIIVYRLAETYLLRAEAYFRNGMLDEAATDINVVRDRAHATPVDAVNVTLDYILDERARELMVEEPRRRTLIRMGKLVERVRKYNLLEITRTSIKDYHEFYPIPQSAIDANFGAELGQNPGY
ncbi:MAG: RagB/SusD family nutrient uptake outer membrane protein [Draconibacterium sp.]